MENEAVVISKYETIQKCINRILEEYEDNPENLDDYRRLDCIVLNLQRACEAVVDIAMYIVSNKKLGVPQTKKEAFESSNINRNITKVNFENSLTTLTLNDKLNVIFPNNENLKYKLALLSEILKSLGEDAVGVIDLTKTDPTYSSF